MGRLKVVCDLGSGVYTPDYVHKLQRMVRRNLTIPHKVVCITEHDVPDVKCVRPKRNWTTGWRYLEFCESGEPFLYIQLDVVITDNIDCLVKTGGGIWACQHLHKPDKHNSSVMYIENAEYLYKKMKDSYITADEYSLKFGNEGEQKFVDEHAKKVHQYPEEWCSSVQKNGLDFKSKVHCFHGFPKQEKVFHTTVTQNWY